jgi:hypothetical protein
MFFNSKGNLRSIDVNNSNSLESPNLRSKRKSVLEINKKNNSVDDSSLIFTADNELLQKWAAVLNYFITK